MNVSRQWARRRHTATLRQPCLQPCIQRRRHLASTQHRHRRQPAQPRPLQLQRRDHSRQTWRPPPTVSRLTISARNDVGDNRVMSSPKSDTHQPTTVCLCRVDRQNHCVRSVRSQTVVCHAASDRDARHAAVRSTWHRPVRHLGSPHLTSPRLLCLFFV